MSFSDLFDSITDHARNWFRLKVVLALISIFLLIFATGIFHPSVLFFKPDAELTYVENTNALDFMFCVKEYKICTVRYELVLGNTGKDDLDKINVSITGLPESLVFWEKHITPLTAINNKDYGAEINEVRSGSEKVLEIKKLKVGTVVELVYQDLQLPIDAAKSLHDKKTSVTIETDAHVVNSDPRLTVVGRMIEANM